MKNILIRTIISTICVAALLISDASLIKAGDLEPSIIEETETIPEEMPAEVVTEDAVEGEHEHNLVYRDNMDGTHTVYCDAEGCDFEAVEEHSFDDEGTCICSQTAEGSEDPVKEEEESDQLLEEDPPSEEEPSEEEVELLEDFEPEKAPEDPEEEDQQEIKAYYGASEFAAEGSFPEDAELVVTPVDKEDVQDLIDDESFVIYEAFDISVLTDDFEWEPENADTVSVVIKNLKISNEEDPDEPVDYTNIAIIHIDDNDNVESYACEVFDEDGDYQSLEFKTPGFSTFAIGGYLYNTDNSIKTWNIGRDNLASVKAHMFYLNNVDDSDGYSLIISGSGAIRDYSGGDFAPWYNAPYKDKLKCAYIEDGITNVSGCLFYACNSLYEVRLPSSITEIRDYAFCSCENLTLDFLPDNITSIGYCSFWGCYNITPSCIPESCTTLKSYSFAYCSKVPFETIPSGITEIPDHAFIGCYRMNFPVMPNHITRIGESAFESCTGFRELLIKSNVTYIAPNAFKGCHNLRRLDLSNVTLSSDYELTVVHYDDDNNYYTTLQAGETYTITLTRDKKMASVEVSFHFDDAAAARPYSVSASFGVLYPSGVMETKTVTLGDLIGSAPNITVYESVDIGYTRLCEVDFDPPTDYTLAGVAINDESTKIDFYFRGPVRYTVILPAVIDDISEGGAITVSGTFPESQVLRVTNISDYDHITELHNDNGDVLKIKLDYFSPGGYTAILGYEGMRHYFRAFYGENRDGYLDFGCFAPDCSYDLLGVFTSTGYQRPNPLPTAPDVVNYYNHPIAYAGPVKYGRGLYLAKEVEDLYGSNPTADYQEANNGTFSLSYAVDNLAENAQILGDDGISDGSYILFKDKHYLSKLGYNAGSYTGNLAFSWSVVDNPYYELRSY